VKIRKYFGRNGKKKCGTEPKFQNYTKGKDSFSVHPFEECFWANSFINLNGKLYMWKDNEWSAIQPTAHLSTLKLTSKFTELEDNAPGDKQQLYLSQNKSIICHFTFSLYNFYFTDTILVNRVQQQV
jgi:hypothetical protein